MLLHNEVRLGEIYVEDKDFFVGEQLPVNLFQLIELPTTKCTYGLYGDKIDTLTNPIWENIATGELVNWGTHCFSTIDRIKTQYKNIDKVHDEKRKKYLQQAIKLINA